MQTIHRYRFLFVLHSKQPKYVFKTTTVFMRKRSLPFLLGLQHLSQGQNTGQGPWGIHLHIKKAGLKILRFCPSFCSFLAVNCQAHYHTFMPRLKSLYSDENNAPLPHGVGVGGGGCSKAQSMFTGCFWVPTEQAVGHEDRKHHQPQKKKCQGGLSVINSGSI